jgi:LAO/AO transport system kinase
MELADLVVINKADLDQAAATRAQAQITSALRIFGLHGSPEHASAFDASGGTDVRRQPEVIQISALKTDGIDRFWAAVDRFRELQTASGAFAARRHAQDQAWMWEHIDAALKHRFRSHPRVKAALPELAQQVRQGRIAASVAARRLLELMD